MFIHTPSMLTQLAHAIWDNATYTLVRKWVSMTAQQSMPVSADTVGVAETLELYVDGAMSVGTMPLIRYVHARLLPYLGIMNSTPDRGRAEGATASEIVNAHKLYGVGIRLGRLLTAQGSNVNLDKTISLALSLPPLLVPQSIITGHCHPSGLCRHAFMLNIREYPDCPWPDTI